MVRPEDVTLAAANAPAANGQLTWPGKVVDGVFRGPRRSLTVETAGLGSMSNARPRAPLRSAKP